MTQAPAPHSMPLLLLSPSKNRCISCQTLHDGVCPKSSQSLPDHSNWLSTYFSAEDCNFLAPSPNTLPIQLTSLPKVSHQDSLDRFDEKFKSKAELTAPAHASQVFSDLPSIDVSDASLIEQFKVFGHICPPELLGAFAFEKTPHPEDSLESKDGLATLPSSGVPLQRCKEFHSKIDAELLNINAQGDQIKSVLERIGSILADRAENCSGKLKDSAFLYNALGEESDEDNDSEEGREGERVRLISSAGVRASLRTSADHSIAA